MRHRVVTKKRLVKHFVLFLHDRFMHDLLLLELGCS